MNHESTPENIAEDAIKMSAPMVWFDDPHGPYKQPRCCLAIKKLASRLRKKKSSRADVEMLTWLVIEEINRTHLKKKST